MSAASGIPVSEQLRHAFGEAHASGAKRLIKVLIKNDELIDVDSMAPVGAFEEDFVRVEDFLDAKDPCVILFRHDEKNENGYRWLMLCYVPDVSKVKDKMTYASSRGHLKQGLGGGLFMHEIFGTVKSDFSFNGYEAYVRMKLSAAPLTESEQAMHAEVAQSATEASMSGGANSSMVHGVSFKADPGAQSAVSELCSNSGDVNYVRLAIDMDKELIILVEKMNITLSDLPSRVPNDVPAFHFFRWDHTHEDTQFHSIIYVYSCPDGSGSTRSAPVKMRMLYSSSKQGAEALVESCGVKVSLKLEVNAGSELSDEVIANELHPPPVTKKATFTKPSAPGKGPRRLTKTTTTSKS
ncbi:actin-binding protein, cofilin/tropomyosin family protein [Pelomyxa schiedti]|nr:actin-binding protein, cofilin/tropomyosin family protein [Pelomyxa schiedti]